MTCNSRMGGGWNKGLYVGAVVNMERHDVIGLVQHPSQYKYNGAHQNGGYTA